MDKHYRGKNLHSPPIEVSRADTKRGIYYDAAKVRAQIQAAEDDGVSGWILWNPSNIYRAEALYAE